MRRPFQVLSLYFYCRFRVKTATASTIVATKMDDEPTFFIAHLVTEAITHTVIAKCIIYGRTGSTFVEEKKAEFDVGLN